MASMTITPSEAETDGCLASLTTYESGIEQWGSWNTLKAEATADGGWTFDHFEYDWSYSGSDGSQSGTKEAYSNPFIGNLTFGRGGFEEYHAAYDTGETYNHTVTAVRAVFNRAYGGNITVTTSASPEGGGSAFPWFEQRSGRVGTQTTFTLVATPEDGYEFKRWEDEGGSLVSKSETASVTKTFTTAQQRFDYKAIFRKLTGLILCNDSGTILHGASGSILHDE